MDTNKSASSIPKYSTFEDFDVFGGKSDISKEEYMQATFRTSDMVNGDARFMAKSELLGSSGSELIGQKQVLATPVEKKEIALTQKENNEAAL